MAKSVASCGKPRQKIGLAHGGKATHDDDLSI
jgi:hypothetical protein